MRGNPGSPGNRSKRSNLFVVRIWREDVGGNAKATGRTGAEGEGGEAWQWKGRVQRAVSGEEHHFQGWPALIDLLEEMLSDKQPRRGGSLITGKRDTKGGTEE